MTVWRSAVAFVRGLHHRLRASGDALFDEAVAPADERRATEWMGEAQAVHVSPAGEGVEAVRRSAQAGNERRAHGRLVRGRDIVGQQRRAPAYLRERLAVAFPVAQDVEAPHEAVAELLERDRAQRLAPVSAVPVAQPADGSALRASAAAASPDPSSLARKRSRSSAEDGMYTSCCSALRVSTPTSASPPISRVMRLTRSSGEKKNPTGTSVSEGRLLAETRKPVSGLRL